jgi:hypothetical protein
LGESKWHTEIRFNNHNINNNRDRLMTVEEEGSIRTTGTIIPGICGLGNLHRTMPSRFGKLNIRKLIGDRMKK